MLTARDRQRGDWRPRDGRAGLTSLAGRVGRARRVADGLCGLGRPSRNGATVPFRLVVLIATGLPVRMLLQMPVLEAEHYMD